MQHGKYKGHRQVPEIPTCPERSTVDVLDVGGAGPSNPAFPRAAASITRPGVCSHHALPLQYFRRARQWGEVVDVFEREEHEELIIHPQDESARRLKRRLANKEQPGRN